MASLGRLGGRGEEMRSAVAESLLFLLLVASLLSVKGPLKIPLFFFFFFPPYLLYPQDLQKGGKKSRYLPCVRHASEPMSHAAPSPGPTVWWLLQDCGDWCLPGTAQPSL